METNATKFWDAYYTALVAAIEKNPGNYMLRENETASGYASRIYAKFSKRPNIDGINHRDSKGMQGACKALGIKFTRTAINAYISGTVS